MDQSFIKRHIKIRYCYKYKGISLNTCVCGKHKDLHDEISKVDENWSSTNNTKLKDCDTYGCIKFKNYDNLPIETSPKFIKFNCEDHPGIDEAIYKLIVIHWRFPSPKLLISVNGGNKRMTFKTNHQKITFIQGLIEVLKKGKTWIIGGGFDVGIHKLVSEAVYEYRLHHDSFEDQVKLIGISTWGVIQNNDELLSEEHTYTNSNIVEKGKVTLNAFYDCFLFCDDGTEKQYGKETEFRLNLEKYLQEREEVFVVQILFEGGKRAIENAYKSLARSIPLVVIKGSGRAADIIYEVLNLPKRTHETDIKLILEEYQNELKLEDDEISKYQDYLCEMYNNYKNHIVIHDILDKSMKLDKKILEAIISSRDDNTLEKTLHLTIRFDCHDIAETKVFQNSSYHTINVATLRKCFKEVLEMNKPEFVKLFLENNFNIDNFLNDRILVELYKKSLTSVDCHCAALIHSLIISEDKSFDLDKLNEHTLDIIYKIIRKLSGNILERRKDVIMDQTPIINLQNRIEQLVNYEMHENVSLPINPITPKDLFLWALLSGYTELAIIIWKIGKDHVGSALIGAIILYKMHTIILKRGDCDISAKLNLAYIKFQELAKAVVTEAYDKNHEKTYTLLTRVLGKWNDMTCLQIALSGDLLDFLNLSACQSYTRQAWMGELSPFLPTWKILITIPFSFVLIKPLIIPTFPTKKPAHDMSLIKRDGSDLMSFNRSLIRRPNKGKINKPQNESFKGALVKFYQAPIVKFVVHLISYILFLLVFAYLNMVELKPLSEFMNITDMAAEIFVYIYIFGIIIEEIRQIVDQERTGNIHKIKAYLTGSWNMYDILVIIISIISIILRFVVSDNYFIIIRCSFAITLSMFCLRTMQYYFISRSIGPKVIMIRKMIVDILFFLSIFVLFILSYGTLAQSLGHPNQKWNLILLKDVFYKPYFQTYGELLLDSMNLTYPCNNTECKVKNSTITIAFAIFLLLTNVLLINLLIAMFGHTFKKIQAESEKIYSYIQMQLVEEFTEKPLAPPPLNILYYIYRCIMNIGNLMCNKEMVKPNCFLVRRLKESDIVKITGFEQSCMESSMTDIIISKDLQRISTSDSCFYQKQSLGDKLNELQNLNMSMKSSKSSHLTSYEKFEKRIKNLIILNSK